MTDCDEYVEDTYTSTLRRKSGRLLIETRSICADIPGARSVRKDCTHALFLPESSVVIERKIKCAKKLTFFFFALPGLCSVAFMTHISFYFLHWLLCTVNLQCVVATKSIWMPVSLSQELARGGRCFGVSTFSHLSGRRVTCRKDTHVLEKRQGPNLETVR